MSEISIKIKGPISRISRITKKKAKAKPKTKTQAYLEKLKGREYSYNTSPFYDYKTGLQPTYIYRQQTIPQLQQDNRNTELIKYLEDIKKSDRQEQTGKLTYTEPLKITDKGNPPHEDSLEVQLKNVMRELSLARQNSDEKLIDDLQTKKKNIIAKIIELRKL